jgi:hypothetical protein
MKTTILLATIMMVVGVATGARRQLPRQDVTSNGPGAAPASAQSKATKGISSQAVSDRKQLRKDPAYRAGYDHGYRRGATDSAANSNSYDEGGGPLYELATDGYSPEYGDREKYQRLFRVGYVDGYKAGWDFNAGRYCGTCSPN